MNTPTQKQCPHCKSEIHAEATKCPNCQTDLRTWGEKNKKMSALLPILGVSVIAVIAYIIFAGDSSPSQTANPPKAQIVSESECQTALSEITAVVEEKPTTKSEISKRLIEQWAVDAGLPVTPRSNTMRYVLPDSTCGKALNGLLIIMFTGA